MPDSRIRTLHDPEKQTTCMTVGHQVCKTRHHATTRWTPNPSQWQALPHHEVPLSLRTAKYMNLYALPSGLHALKTHTHTTNKTNTLPHEVARSTMGRATVQLLTHTPDNRVFRMGSNNTRCTVKDPCEAVKNHYPLLQWRTSSNYQHRFEKHRMSNNTSSIESKQSLKPHHSMPNVGNGHFDTDTLRCTTPLQCSDNKADGKKWNNCASTILRLILRMPRSATSTKLEVNFSVGAGVVSISAESKSQTTVLNSKQPREQPTCRHQPMPTARS